MEPKNLKFPYRWEERRPEVHEGVLFIPDHYEKHTEWKMPGWETIFGNVNPVTIEYCSGNGTWIAEKAKDKSRNWVAVEWRFDRVQKIWAKKKREGLDNLFIVCGDARVFIRDYLKEGSVEGVYVNFPDPWPKFKHAKNRLFQEEFIAEMARTVRSGGEWIVATDDPPYGEQLVREVGGNAAWKSCFEKPYYVTEWEGYGASFFDALWREKGRMIRYFRFQRI